MPGSRARQPTKYPELWRDIGMLVMEEVHVPKARRLCVVVGMGEGVAKPQAYSKRLLCCGWLFGRGHLHVCKYIIFQ